ncbi:MAG TPA: hypothetical protein VK848_01645 [Acidimicrobiia bacterium]|nr:hypothetical protein [Acidimicrobiia bacterium]
MPAAAAGSGRVDTVAGDRRGVGVGVHLSAGTGGGDGGLGDGGFTLGAASGTDADGEGADGEAADGEAADGEAADGLGDGATAVVREALHPAAASRMNRPAAAIRFVNGALLR